MITRYEKASRKSDTKEAHAGPKWDMIPKWHMTAKLQLMIVNKPHWKHSNKSSFHALMNKYIDEHASRACVIESAGQIAAEFIRVTLM